MSQLICRQPLQEKTTKYRTGFSLIPVRVICLHMQCGLTLYAFGYRIQRDEFLLLMCLLQGMAQKRF